MTTSECEFCGKDHCIDNDPCDEKSAQMDNWFYSDGIDILSATHKAMDEQGDDFVFPHNREELDDLIDKL